MMPSAPVPGLKEGSIEPSEFRRAMLFRLRPPREVNSPAITSLPSGWRASAQTVPLGPFVPGLNEVSREPSELRRATRRRLVTSKEENSPAMKIFPSGWTAVAQTGASAPCPGLKEKSSEPSEFNLAMPFRGVELKEAKPPPTTIWPLVVRRSEEIKSSAPPAGLKVESIPPSAFIRAIHRRPIV